MPCCGVCGADQWQARAIIWDGLATEWNLSDDEREYVNVQQGHQCERCGASFRSAALADAVCLVTGWAGTFAELCEIGGRGLAVLEVNEAGTLAPYFEKWDRHVIGRFPEVDMQRLPHNDETFDLVVHSDTLEHVPDPIAGLRECLRVLRPGGHLVYTIPIVVGRMSRTRAGMSPSYHGIPGVDDYLVISEYGADFWTEPVIAGFGSVSLHPYSFPASVVVLATRRSA